MCVFSFLADPFYYTLLLSLLYAVIYRLGYTRSAELIYSSFMAVFGRAEYKKFTASWNDLKSAKVEVKKVSAQDEFAKWAKLQRKVDKLQSDYDKQYSSRQKSLLAFQFVGSIVLRVICYTSILAFFYYNTATSAMSLDLLKPELQKFPWIESVLAFPFAEKGDLSVTIWALISFVGMGCLLTRITGLKSIFY